MHGQSAMPLSPDSTALFALFTTLDEELSPTGNVEENQITKAKNHKSKQYERPIRTVVTDGVSQANESLLNPTPPRIHTAVTSRNRVPKLKLQDSNLPGYICFSAVTGEPAKASKRSAFSKERRMEVMRVRKLGACLRCKLRKITCSGGNPCMACVTVAQATTGSRALSWMKCVRPSLDKLSIFDPVDLRGQRTMIENITQTILGNTAMPETIPFAMDLESATKHIANWLVDGTNHLSFSLGHFLRSRELGHMLHGTLGADTGNQLRTMIFITNNITFREDLAADYRDHSLEELDKVRSYMGNAVLTSIDTMLRPVNLETSRRRPQVLHSLFLILFSFSVTARYSYLEAMLHGTNVSNEKKQKTEAFIRLLNYYQVYIGRILGLFEASAEENLITICGFQWDIAGSFVSCNAENLTSKNSLQQLNDAASTTDIQSNQIPEPPEPSECAFCHTWWASTDSMGFCRNCQLAQNLSVSGFSNMIPVSSITSDLGSFETSISTSDTLYNTTSEHIDDPYIRQWDGFKQAFGSHYTEPGNGIWCSWTPSSENVPSTLVESFSGITTNRNDTRGESPNNSQRKMASNCSSQSACGPLSAVIEAPKYWIFYNQHGPFQIYNNGTQTRYTYNATPSNHMRRKTSPSSGRGVCETSFRFVGAR